MSAMIQVVTTAIGSMGWQRRAVCDALRGRCFASFVYWCCSRCL
ncbi:hypothetical protein [Synechococcus sp. W4D4]